MNFISSQWNHENCRYEGSPAQGPSRGTAGQFVCFSEISVLIRRGGVPSGAAAYIIIGGMGISTPIILSERMQFSWEILRTILTRF